MCKWINQSDIDPSLGDTFVKWVVIVEWEIYSQFWATNFIACVFPVLKGGIVTLSLIIQMTSSFCGTDNITWMHLEM
jgi:hypothetical protein